MDAASRRRFDLAFVLLLLLVASVRIGLLFASQYSVCGDEATVGIMARHIVERGERPMVAYRAHYNGGSALTAYMATVPFALFGMTERALKLVPLGLSLLALVAVYLFVRSLRGARSALFAALFYATTVLLLKWNFDARGGYMEGQVLMTLACWLLIRRCLRAQPSTMADLALGLLCGFGFYVLPIFIAMGATSFIFLVARDRRRGTWQGTAAWMVGAITGTVPFWLGADAGGLGLAHHGSFGRDPVSYLLTLWRTLTHHLPGALAYNNLDLFPKMRLAPNLVEYGVLLAGIAALVFLRRDVLAASYRSLWKRSEGWDALASGEAVLLAYPVVYVLLYGQHPMAGLEARHLVYLEPVLSILAGLGFAEALARGRPRALQAAAALLMAASLVDRGAEHVRVLNDHSISGPRGLSDPRTAEIMIAFLDAQGIRRIMCADWDLSWRIVFKTGERITATHSTEWLRRLLRERDLRRDPYAVIVDANSPEEESVRSILVKRGFQERALVVDKAVYLLKGPPRPPAPKGDEVGSR